MLLLLFGVVWQEQVGLVLVIKQVRVPILWEILISLFPFKKKVDVVSKVPAGRNIQKSWFEIIKMCYLIESRLQGISRHSRFL